MDLETVRSARVAVLGVDTTTGNPPLIAEAVLYHMEAGTITDGPYGYWVAPAAPLHQVRISAWPNVRLAPPWSEVAGRITDAIGDRILAVHYRNRLEIMRRHLPGWEPSGVLVTSDLAEQAWPGLADYSLGMLSSQVPSRGGGAAAEAHAVTLLLNLLLGTPATWPGPTV
jgi:hypothetical protein